MLGDIDWNKKIPKPQLFLAKPNRQIIAKLKHAYPPNLKLNLGNVNELEFDLPFYIDIFHKLKRYEPVDLIRTRYLIKFELMDKIEWFIIDKLTDEDGSNGKIKHIHAYSLSYQLRDKRIRNYQVESYTLSQLVNDALSKTNWSIGFIDPSFDNKYRSFDVSSQTVLEFIFDVAETFEALVDFDTQNKQVNFLKLDTYGQNKGLIFSYGKYLKSINRDIDTTNVFTRIIPYGDNDLSIRGVNPTGLDYIDDYSYYMYPFQRDENRNVISHSYYMSDDLCHAILDYGELVSQHKDEFKNLNNQKSTLQQQLTTEQNTLTDLQTKLKMAQDEQDIQKGMETFTFIEYTYNNKSQTNTVTLNNENKYAVMVYVSSINNLTIKVNNSVLSLAEKDWVINKITGFDSVSIVADGSAINVDVKIYVLEITDEEYNTDNNNQALLEKYNDSYLQSLIDAQQAVVDGVQSQIDDIDLQISNLKNILDVKNNFTEEQIEELNDYVFEYEWTDTNYIDAQELYDDAVEKLKQLNAPPTVINIDIFDFLSNIESQRDWDKLVLGDYVTIKYDEFGIKVEAQINGIEFNFRDQSIQLTITNLKDVKDSQKQVLEQLYSNAVAGITVDMNKSKWDLAQEAKTSIDNLMNSVWDATNREITAGVNESVKISGRGITITNPNDPNKMLIAQSGVIALSNDGGKNWTTAIKPDGIIAKTLIGEIIIGENLLIQNEAGKFSFTKDGAVFDGTSLSIIDNGNGISLDPVNGIIITRADNKVKTTLNATNGFKIQSSTDGITWNDKFFVDVDGNIVARSLTIDNSNSGVIIDNNGISINNGFLAFQDFYTGNKYNVVPKSNLINDHGFELVNYEYSGSYMDKDIYPMIDTDEAMWSWNKVGTPYVQLYSGWGTRNTIFGLQSIIVNNGNYVYSGEIGGIKLGTKYTISGHFSKSLISNQSGTPVIKIEIIDTNTSQTLWSTTLNGNKSVPSDGSVSRYAFTFITPTSLSSSEFYLKVSVMSNSTVWIMADGIELVEGDIATLYNEETTVWKLLSRGISAREILTDKLSVRKELDANNLTVNSSFTTNVNLLPSIDMNLNLGSSSQRFNKAYIGTVYQGSSIEIKENIVEFDGMLTDRTDGQKKRIYDLADKIRIYKYNYKDDDELQLGIIAEEAPLEIVDSNGKNVGLYSYINMIFQFAKDIKNEVEKLKENKS